MTTIIIPCYNEEKRLQLDKFRAWAEQHPDYKLLFVNDGSKDNTLEVLQQAAAHCRSFAVLNLPKNGGKAEAVRQGILFAINESPQPDAVAFYDADMATPARDLDKMIGMTKDYEMVVGCRVLRLGGAVERTFFRFLTGRMFATVAAGVLNLPVYDTQCGAKVFRRKTAQQIFAEPFITGWIFDVEIFARIAILHGWKEVVNKIYEFPLSAWHDVSGSKVGKWEFVRQIFALQKIKKYYRLGKQ